MTKQKTTYRLVGTPRTLSIGKDPLSQWLILASALAIIGALLTAIIAFTSGILTLNHAPQTIAQADVVRAQSGIKTNGTAQEYANLVISQANNGSITEAEATLKRAQTLKLDVQRTQALAYAEGYLNAIKGNTDGAIASYQQVADALTEAYESEKARGGDMNWALADGKPENYYLAILALSQLYGDKHEPATQCLYLDDYLKGRPNDGGALIERGNVKLRLDDTQGAQKDFERALKFLPQDAEATAGLAKAKAR
jgi:tetratricopeptide (TPR) repeat protein